MPTSAPSTIHSGGSGTAAPPAFSPLLAPSWGRPDLSFLSERSHPAPAFPRQLLGAYWAEWCEETATGASAPYDYVAVGLLTVAGSLIGNARIAQVGDWKEPPILWTTLVGDPSTNKSPALDPLLRIVKALQQDSGQDEFLLGDSTPRATAESAELSPKGNLLVRDEQAAWWKTFGHAGGEQFWLQAFGARSHSVRRANGQRISIKRLAVSALGGTQPDVIKEVLRSRPNTGFSARLIYVMPETRRGYRIAQPVNHALAHQALERLWLLEATGTPASCPLDPTAHAHFEAWVNANMDACASGADGPWTSWLAKQRGIALRVALIRDYLLWAAEAPLAASPPSMVSRDSYMAACDFIDGYASPMARRVLASTCEAPEVQAASALIGIVRRACASRFNAAQVRRGGLGPAGMLRSPQVMKAACEVLEAAHLIRHVGVRSDGRAGRQPQDYEVNPAALRS